MWREIKGYRHYYEINEEGQVRSRDRFIPLGKGRSRFKKGQLMNIRLNNWGYLEVRLNIDGKTKTHFIHRLLAQAFIPNPYNKPFVNHKNGIKTDNHIDNLEWVTQAENIIHAYKHGLCFKGAKHYNSKTLLDKETGKVFFCLREAANEYGAPYSTFRNYLNTNKDRRFIKW